MPDDDLNVQPAASAINFAPDQTRANNTLALLAFDGSGDLKVITSTGGTADFILDVNGYFE